VKGVNYDGIIQGPLRGSSGKFTGQARNRRQDVRVAGNPQGPLRQGQEGESEVRDNRVFAGRGQNEEKFEQIGRSVGPIYNTVFLLLIFKGAGKMPATRLR